MKTDTGESADAYNAEQMSRRMAVREGVEFNRILDKALKHGRLMNHWLDKARRLIRDESRETR